MRPRAFPILLASLSIVGCSDPAAPEAVVDEPDSASATDPATALIGPSGGALSVTTEEGVVVTVSIPPQALGNDVDVTLRPLPAEAGRWFSVEVEPSWLRFYAPFEVIAVLPPAMSLDEAGLLLGSGARSAHLPTRIDRAARRISSNALTFFDLPATSGGATPGSVPSSAPALSTGPGSGQIGGGPASCSAIEANAMAALDDLEASGAYEAAIRVVLSAGALLQKEGCDPTALLELATPMACEQAEAAISHARTTPISTYRDFERQVGPILRWAGLLDLLGADCAPAGEWLSALDPEIEDFLEFFNPRLGGLTESDWVTFRDLREEALSVMTLYGDVWALGISPEAAEKLLSNAFIPAVARMRDVGFALCRNDGWHYPLSRVTSTGLFSGRDIIGQTPPRPGTVAVPPDEYADFTDSDVFRDLQYCGTSLDIEGVVTSGGVLASQSAGAEGAVGDYVGEISLAVPTRGQLRFGGDLLGFTCWNDIDADSELEVALGGSVVRTLERDGDGYVGEGPLSMDLGVLAEAAGITPREGTSHDLVFTRVRSACDERLWGPERFDLIRVTLEWRNPTLEVDVVLPDTLQVGSEYEATVYVDVVDLLGEPARFADIEVALDVQGASASTLSGTTDASGAFTTTLVLDDAAVEAVTVVANATSFEGVTGTGARTAAVAAHGARMVYSRFSASGDVYIGQTVDEGGDVVTGALEYDGSFSVAVSEAGSGNITLDGSLTTSVTLDADNRITSIVGQASSNLQKVATGNRVNGSGGGGARVRFEVIGVPMEVTLGASVFGRPENYSTSVGAETGTAQVRLSRRDPRDHNVQTEELLFITAWTSDPPLQTTLVLEPGVYEIFGAAGTATGGTNGCMECEVSAEATIGFELTFGGG